MAGDAASFLNELTIWKLKAVANELNIDVSSCKYKRDYVMKITSKKLTEERVRAALEKTRESKASKQNEKDEDVAEIKAIKKDIESIAAPSRTQEVLLQDEANVIERHIDEALMMKPSMFEIDSRTEAAHNRMIMGDYAEALSVNSDARIKCLESFSAYQVYSAAVSIRAADELFAKLKDNKGHINSTLLTALAEAKKAFIDGNPRRREEALENLETLATKAYKAFFENTEKGEAELLGLLADYESFGARTDESRKYLEIATQAKREYNTQEYSRFLNTARESAERAKDARVKEIDAAFGMVRIAAAEAHDVGAETAAAEANIKSARKAFDDGAFRQALELLLSVERAVDLAHLEQIRSKREIEARQLDKIQGSLAFCEPVLLEASSYGMDIQDGLIQIVNAKRSLGQRDLVAAAKAVRKAKEMADTLERALDQKRLELRIITHVDDAKCGKCGQESLYLYPGSRQKCLECGHSFVMPVEPLPAKVKETAQQAPDQAGPSDVVPGMPQQPAEAQPIQSRTKAEDKEKKKRWLPRW